MRSSLPKMLHPVCGRPMVAWPILAAREAGAGRVAAIVSPGRDISAGLPEGVETVVQPEPDGTGGAVRAALPLIEESETVLVLSGDHPLISAENDRRPARRPRSRERRAATMLTIELDDPGSYGRVVRDASGEVERVVEAKAAGDADAGAAGDPRDQRRHLRLRGGPARRGPRRALQRQRPGRVLPARRLPGPARGGPHGRRPPLRGPRGDDGRQQPRRPGRGRGRGAPPHPRGPHARRRHRRRSRLDLDRRRASRSPPTPGSSPAPACAARPTIGAGSIVGPLTTLIDTHARRRRLRRRTPTWSSARSATAATVGPFAYLRPGALLDAGRQGRHLRRDQELAASARAPRSPTSPTSATPTSGPAATSAPARSPPTTTDSASTGRDRRERPHRR